LNGKIFDDLQAFDSLSADTNVDTFLKMKVIIYSAAFIALAATTLDAAGGFRGKRPGKRPQGHRNSTRPGHGMSGGRNATKFMNCSDDGNHTKFRNHTEIKNHTWGHH
jgi:hypothetical protein